MCGETWVCRVSCITVCVAVLEAKGRYICNGLMQLRTRLAVTCWPWLSIIIVIVSSCSHWFTAAASSSRVHCRFHFWCDDTAGFTTSSRVSAPLVTVSTCDSWLPYSSALWLLLFTLNYMICTESAAWSTCVCLYHCVCLSVCVWWTLDSVVYREMCWYFELVHGDIVSQTGHCAKRCDNVGSISGTFACLCLLVEYCWSLPCDGVSVWVCE